MKNTVIVNIVVSGILFAVFLVSVSIVFGQVQTVQSSAELAQEAKYTIGQARRTALRQCPGIIETEGLKKENGTIFYLFEIRDEYNIFVNVKVDAITGKLLFDEKVNPIPKMVSGLKNGSVHGFKMVGQGIRSVANIVVELFPD